MCVLGAPQNQGRHRADPCMREAEPVRAERDFPLETFAVDPVQPVELAPRRTARASQKRRRISNLDLVDHDNERLLFEP